VRRQIRRWVVVGLTAIVLTAVSAGCGGGAAPAAQTGSAQLPFAGHTLVVTTYGGSWQTFMENTIVPAFEKQTGAKVELAVGLATNWVAKLKAAGKSNPPYDVVIANETYVSGLRQDGYFADLPADKVPNLKDVAPQLRNPNDNGVLGLINPLGLAYMKDKVKNPPQSWQDLWKPEYKGQICLYSAANSAMPMVVMNTARVFGGSPQNLTVAFQKLKELLPFKMSDFTGNVQQLLTQGECAIALLDSPTWAQMVKQGINVGFVVPSDGFFIFEQDMNVTAGSKEKDLGYAFINYMLSAPVQTEWVKGFYEVPANTQVQIPADLQQLIPVSPKDLGRYVKWDWNWLNSDHVLQDVVNQWNKDIAANASK
jgi:putative spermidine/putrescine transport system substrate-binding protein